MVHIEDENNAKYTFYSTSLISVPPNWSTDPSQSHLFSRVLQQDQASGSTCHPASLSSCQFVILSSCHHVVLSSCHLVLLSSCPLASLAAYQFFSLSICQFQICQLVNLLVCELLSLYAFQLAHLGACEFVSELFRPLSQGVTLFEQCFFETWRLNILCFRTIGHHIWLIASHLFVQL